MQICFILHITLNDRMKIYTDKEFGIQFAFCTTLTKHMYDVHCTLNKLQFHSFVVWRNKKKREKKHKIFHVHSNGISEIKVDDDSRHRSHTEKLRFKLNSSNLEPLKLQRWCIHFYYLSFFVYVDTCCEHTQTHTHT